MPIELGKSVGVRMPVYILEAYEAEHASTGIHVSTLARRDLMAGFSMRNGAKERSTENTDVGAVSVKDGKSGGGEANSPSTPLSVPGNGIHA